MTLLPFFTWCNDLTVSGAIRESLWLFPIIEVFHLLGLSVIGGAVLIVDLRLLGLGLTSVPASRLARAMAPWLAVSLAVVVLSGVLLFLSEALKCYENPAFWLKMVLLALAILFACVVRPRWTRPVPVAGGWLVALVSLALWTGVAMAGRGIGFY
jgi:hypothetical protein